jgi:tetratricopeptide (TPR) repeat protein
MKREKLLKSALLGVGLTAIAVSTFVLGKSESTDPPKIAVRAPTRLETLQKLALADSRGTSAIDQRLLALRVAAERNPKKIDLWVALGEAWIAKARDVSDPGFYLHADAAADVALALDAEHAPALDLKGLVALNDHRFEEARTIADRVLGLRPDDVVAHGIKSDALFELGDIAGAAASAQAMLDLKPSLPSYGRVAYLAWIHGHARESMRLSLLAIDSGRDAHAVEPWAWQLVQTAMLLWHEGDYEGAAAGCERAERALHDYPPALACSGRAALSLGHVEDAAKLLERAYAKSPLVETGALLVDAETALGRTERAREVRSKIERDGRSHDRRTIAAFWSSHGENATEALALIEEEAKTRGGIYTNDARAWALYRAGRFAEAKAASDRALSHGTKDARLLYHAGAIRIALGEEDAGRALVAEALERNPSFEPQGAREARSLLSMHGAEASR